MITIKEAIGVVKKAIPDSIPQAVYGYKDGYYMVVAPQSKDGDLNAPFYLVRKSNGDMRAMSPLEDLEAFQKTMEGGPLLKIG